MEWDILVTPSRRMRDEKMQQQLLHSPRSKGGHDEETGVGGDQMQWEIEREMKHVLREGMARKAGCQIRMHSKYS